MIKKYWISLLVVVGIIFSSTNEVKATHAMGVDLTYICLGNGQYAITVSFYRDCSGISAPPDADVTLTSSCSTFTVTLPQVSFQEISSLCPTAVSTCQGGSEPGAEQYIYTDTVTLPPCADWTFWYTECCRNPLITNLTSPGSQQMYVEATLDNTGPNCNSSPIFTTLPVPYICVNQPYSYNHGAIDVDGDSLYYSLVTPLTNGGALIPYMPGYSSSYPVFTNTGSVNFNNNNGQMSMTPNQTQVCVVTVLVEEYRNGVLIGSTMRDIQILVLNCGNLQPELDAPGIFNLSGGTLLDTLSVELCVGSNLSYQFTASDPNVTDVLTMTSNAALALPGASFTASGNNPVTGSLNWTPSANDIGYHTYAVTVQDDGCPVMGTQTYAFEIIVISGTYAGSDIYLCEDDTVQLNVGGGTSFQWTPAIYLSNDTLSNPLAYPDSTISYVVTSDLTGACGNIDTVTIYVVPDFNVSTNGEQILCIGGSAQLGVNANPGSNYQYLWTPSATLNFDTIPNPLATTSSTTNYTVAVSSPGGCTKTVSQLVTVNPTPLSADPTITDPIICQGGSTQLQANIDAGDCNNYVVSTIPYSPISGSGNAIVLGDDQLSAPLGIGFDFVFFCNFYDMFYVSSNGFMSFNSGAGHGCCSGQVLPNASNPNNLVAFCWNDFSPNLGGTIEYFTYGTAPNRVLVLNFAGVPHYGGGNNVTQQILLYENSNVIEIHTANMPTSTGAHTMGIENNGGTSAFTAAGRNGTTWTASNEGVRFTPLVPPPFTVTWYDPDSNIVSSTENFNVSPDSSITYTLVVTDGACSDISNVSVEVVRVEASPDTGMCYGDSVQINAQYLGPTGALAPTSCGLAVTTCTGSSNNYVVGTGNTTNSTTTYPAPYGNYYKNAKHQILYKETELTAAGVTPGTITNIGFFVQSVIGTNTYYQYEIKISCTTASSLSMWQTGLQTVFLPKNVNITPGVNNHVLDFPFDWDGTSNLIVEICYNNLALNYTSNSASPYTITSYNSVLYYNSDMIATCPYTGIANTSNKRPNTQFVICTDSITPVYTWTPSAGLSDPNVANPMASPLMNTQYIVTVDNGSCTLTDTVVVNPTTFSMTSSSIDEVCKDDCVGEITITPQGDPPFSYIWSDPDTQITQTATGLCSGTYTVTVTDASGCSGVTFATINPGTELISGVIDTVAATCYGLCDGISSMMVAGGSLPFTYEWDNTESTSTATALCAGWHMVTMTDANGCNTIDSAYIREPSNLTTSTASTCFGACNGVATTTPIGGVPPYTYSWDDPINQTTSIAVGLCAGTYSATVIDSNNCMVIDTIVVLSPATQMSATVCSDTICGNNATVSIQNGTPPFTYVWNNGQVSAVANGLCPGSYSVQIIDSAGCVLNDTAIIPEPILSQIIDTVNTSCDQGCDGSATASIGGGTGPYNYLWDDPMGQTDSTATGLCQGTYNVIVTDANGCTHSSSVIISSPQALSSLTSATCVGICDGIALSGVTGGTAPYFYLWDDPMAQTDSVATGLCVGSYTVIITDANGCAIIDSTSISAPSNSFSITDATCLGQCDGLATSFPLGGTPPYNYLWDDPANQTNASASNLCVGIYNITITDSLGCQLHDYLLVSESSPLGSQLDVHDDVTCYGLCDGLVGLVPSEGVPPYTYLWNDPASQTNNTAYNLCAGNYVLTITDNDGCMKLDTITIEEPTVLQIGLDSTSLQHVMCNGECNGQARVVPSGATPPYSYSWSDPTSQTTPTAYALCGGNYVVNITDNNDCKDTILVTIEEPAKLLASITDTLRLKCEYHCDAFATVSPTGGREPYTYQWNDPALQNTPTATGLCAGTYVVNITDSSGCIISVNDTISAIPAPPLVADFIANPIATTLFNPLIDFTDLSTGGSSVVWDFGDGTIDSSFTSSNHEYPSDQVGTYVVWQYIENDLGCQDSIQSEIIIKSDYALFAPNAFTPNGDGLNDYFFPEGFGIDKENFDLYIYNRWGDVIYETDDIESPWNGMANGSDKVCQTGVYVWMIVMYDLDGIEHNYVGKVTLLR